VFICPEWLINCYFSSCIDEAEIPATREAAGSTVCRYADSGIARRQISVAPHADRHVSCSNRANSDSTEWVYDRLAKTSPPAHKRDHIASKPKRYDFEQDNLNLNSASTDRRFDRDFTQRRSPSRTSPLLGSRDCVPLTQHHQQSLLKTSPQSAATSTHQRTVDDLVTSSRPSPRPKVRTLSESSPTSHVASRSHDWKVRLLESTEYPRPLPPSPRGLRGKSADVQRHWRS